MIKVAGFPNLINQTATGLPAHPNERLDAVNLLEGPQLRRALMLALGWQWWHSEVSFVPCNTLVDPIVPLPYLTGLVKGYEYGSEEGLSDLPPYDESLDLMAKLESKLYEMGLAPQYEVYLSHLIYAQVFPAPYAQLGSTWIDATAPALLRARAALLTLETFAEERRVSRS